MTTKRALLILLAVAVIFAPFYIGDGSGTDDQAADAVGQLRPDYRPWAKALWEPSEAAEPYLFALQAALGVAFIAYFFHRHRRRTD